MTRAELRLAPAAGALWALAVLGVHQGTRAVVLGTALVIVVALVPALLVGRARMARIVLAHVLLLLIGVVTMLPAVARVEAAVELLARAESEHRAVVLDARVLEDPRPAKAGAGHGPPSLLVPVVVPAGTIEEGGGHRALPTRLRVLLIGPGPATADSESTREAVGLADLGIGDHVRIRGTPRVEGAFVMVRVSRIESRQPAHGLRAGLRERARAATAELPDDEAALARGVATGDTAGLSTDAEEAMRGAGLTHLVAVSGANIAVVLGAVLVPLLIAGVRRRPRLIAAGVAGAGYVSLVGDQPSVLRAATMAIPMLVARWIGIRASPVAALSATVGIWSMLQPLDAASIGFLLSALATAAILIAAPAAAGAIVQMSGERIGREAALVLAVPLVAQAACTPVLILLTPQVSAWAVPANLLAGPLVAPASLCALAAVVFGPFSQTLASALWWPAAGSSHLVLMIAHTADALPGAHLAVPAGAGGALLAVAVIAGAAGAIAARRRRWVRWLSAATAVVILAPPLAQCTPWFSAAGDGWILASCAVGQGDATVLRGHPEGGGSDAATVLIDTGPDPALLTACLDALDVDRIDLLVLTHPHADHVDGRTALTGARVPQEQWICPMPDAARAVADGPAPQPATRGTQAGFDGIDLEVLWPVSVEDIRRVGARETSESEQSDANDCSIVIAATWPDSTRYVGLADLEPEAQGELLRLDPGTAQLVKVAHHGSRRQDPGLYERFGPQMVLYSAGLGNSFGHPAPATISLTQQLGAQEVRTDVDGTIVLTPPEPSAAPEAADGSAQVRWSREAARSVGPAR